MFNLLFKCSSSSQILSCMHFGGACNSKLHFLTEEPENLCITFNSISNIQVLAKYLKDTTPWRTLWANNSVGGCPCTSGRLQHPVTEKCCYGNLRAEVLAQMLISMD